MGMGFALGHAGDGQGDELLGVLAGAVVVGAVGRHHVQAVGVVVGPHQMVAAGLAGAVGAVGGVGHGFMELAGLAEGAVDLVRADVQEAAVLLARPGLAGGFQHGEGAAQVGLDELGRARDAAVDMAFRRQVEDLRDAVLLEEIPGQLQILDVAHDQFHALQAFDLLRVRRIGELVQHQDAILRVVPVPAMHQVAADEAGAAGDEDGVRHEGSPQRRKGFTTKNTKDAKGKDKEKKQNTDEH